MDNEDQELPGADDAVMKAAMKAERLAKERSRLLLGSVAGQNDTVMKRVAIVLNHFPETRDSDIKLLVHYWRAFAGWDGRPISEQDLYELPKLTSLVRARAKIQNQLELFQASATVKRRRHTLEEEERESALTTPARSPSVTIFADESGKTESNLIVGGIWFGNSGDVFKLLNSILPTWREKVGFTSEFHFKEINDENERRYREVFELVLANAPSIAFKALRQARKGLPNVDGALDDLFYHFLVRGIRHEDETGRSPLPRSVEFWKDQEDPNRDALRLANLKDRVGQAGASLFQGRLVTGLFESVPSHEVDLMQIADLFVGAVARKINTPGMVPKAKDRFADFVLCHVHMPDGPESLASNSDIALAAKL